MDNSSNNRGNIRKFLPLISLIILSVLLMIFFKHSKKDIDFLMMEGKKNLALFYSKNLKPLFVQSEISEEDIFNFALYNTLPIDKNNSKVLVINNDNDDNLIYEIKPEVFNSSTNNYERFAEYLDLDAKQKNQADSILRIYKEKVSLSVLTNDENTIVVNKKLGELQKALFAEILSFAQKTNSERTGRIFNIDSKFIQDAEMAKFIISAKDYTPNEFVFITPDTAFSTIWKSDPVALKQEIEKFEKNRKEHNATDFNFDFRFDENDNQTKIRKNGKTANALVHLLKPDSNILKVRIPVPPVPEFNNLQEEIRLKLEKAANSIKRISISHRSRNDSTEKIKISVPANEDENMNFEFNFNEISPLLNQSLEILSKGNIQDWEEFGTKMDSIAEEFSKNLEDTIKKRKIKFNINN